MNECQYNNCDSTYYSQAIYTYKDILHDVNSVENLLYISMKAKVLLWDSVPVAPGICSPEPLAPPTKTIITSRLDIGVI
jgi:hypothetical protein